MFILNYYFNILIIIQSQYDNMRYEKYYTKERIIYLTLELSSSIKLFLFLLPLKMCIRFWQNY